MNEVWNARSWCLCWQKLLKHEHLLKVCLLLPVPGSVSFLQPNYPHVFHLWLISPPPPLPSLLLLPTCARLGCACVCVCVWCNPSCPHLCGRLLLLGRLTWFFWCVSLPVWAACWYTPLFNQMLKPSHCLAFHAGAQPNWFWQLVSKHCAGQEHKCLFSFFFLIVEVKCSQSESDQKKKTKQKNNMAENEKWVWLTRSGRLHYWLAALEEHLRPSVFSNDAKVKVVK